MTIDQKIAALTAIIARQNVIRACLSGDPSPAVLQHGTTELEDLEGAYDAISAIEPEWSDGGDPVEEQ